MCLYVYVPYICIHVTSSMATFCGRGRTLCHMQVSESWGAVVYVVQLLKWDRFHTFLWSPSVPGCHSRLSVWMVVFRPP